MITGSAGQAAHRLAFYRVAYGLGGEGGDGSGSIELRDLGKDLMEGSKV